MVRAALHGGEIRIAPDAWGPMIECCLLDLARAEGALGRDPVPDLKAARELLLGCGAGLYVKDADAALGAYA
jgi:hypothetical protein